MRPLEEPAAALARLLDLLKPVSTEHVDMADAFGRVLGHEVVADRPSPSVAVTAMDGFAVRLADLPGVLPVAGEVAIGQQPPELPAGATVRIFTGGAVPADAEAVIKREDVVENGDSIEVPAGLAVEPGQHIRRAGENLQEGELVLEGGVAVDSAVAAALSTFGFTRPFVHHRVGVGIIVTGDEVLPPDSVPTPWQLRDSNGASLAALVASVPWAEVITTVRQVDKPDLLYDELEEALDRCHVVLITGGVSMGDYDFVPDVVARAGADIVFHGLSQRPGKPMLGAVGPEGQAILGLPGNPVSVMATARRLGVPVLRKLAGFSRPDPPPPEARLADPDDQNIDLWWNRLVRMVEPGVAELVPTRGSGDLVSAARSDGFVVIPPGRHGPGPWPYYGWGIR